MYALPTTILGRTGLRVTRLGIGGAYCKTPEGYRAALDCGVTYLDTAPAYHDGEDERIVGEAIAGRRHEIVLATKTGKRDAAGARAELEKSLRLLGTDYIDVWQIHYLNTVEEREQVLGPGGAMEAAVKAREQGLVRFIGVTGHVWAEVGHAVATGLFDTVLCWYNCAMREPEEVLFPHALAHNVGVVIMQATRMEKLRDPGDASPERSAGLALTPPPLGDYYRYVLGHPAVSVVLRGMRNVEEFGQVAAALSERETLAEAERRQLEAYGAAMLAAGKLDL